MFYALQNPIEPEGRPPHKESILNWVQVGQPVYDIDEMLIGSVSTVHNQNGTADNLLIDLPPELSDPLYQEGYIKVNAGTYALAYFVLPYQIADITQQAIYLHVAHRDLIQV